MRFPILALAALLGHGIATTPLHAEGRSIIVLDASGSMWGQIDGRAKLEIAREALGSVLEGIDPATEIGLMAYGHRTKGDCGDIELVVPPGPGTAQAITDAANAMKFLGKTPLSAAVKQAAEELRYTEDAATVILITDGIETCEADPCALGAALEEAGVNFTAHVVGFGLTEEEGRAVACLAENTGGRYIQASDAGALVEALKTTVVEVAPEPEPAPPEPQALAENVDPRVLLVEGGQEPDMPIIQDVVFSFTPLAADGTPTGDSTTIFGRSLGSLPQGRYRMVTELHKAKAEQIVDIGPDSELSTPTAILDAGILDLKLLDSAGSAPNGNAFWELRGADDLYDSGFGKTFRVFPAGEHEIVAKLEEINARQSVVIEAGETTEVTIILAGGVPVFTAFYAEGVPVEGAQAFEVYEAKAGLDGKRPYIRTDYGAGSAPILPPGDYVVVGKVDEAVAEVAFSVKPGERFDVPVILNAGIAAILAPNASAIEIYEGSVGLDGKRPYVRTDYGDQTQQVLPAGDYVALVKVGEATAEGAFTVVAAQRTETTITMAVGMAAISVPGGEVLEIYEAKTGLDGKRPYIRTEYGEGADLMLPPGDYVVAARSGRAEAETAFTVTDGQRVEVSVTIPRGVAAVAALGANSIRITGPKALDGSSQSIETAYGESLDMTLSPGDYIAVADFGDGVEVEQPFTLADGQRLELQIAKP